MSLLRAILPLPCGGGSGGRYHFGCRSSIPVFPRLFQSPNRASLEAAASVSGSSPSIFLPFLEEEEDLEDRFLLNQGKESEEEELEDEVDPIGKFFKSRASITKDSAVESKLWLKKNRRTAWHLEIDKVEEPEFELDGGGNKDVRSVELRKRREWWRG